MSQSAQKLHFGEYPYHASLHPSVKMVTDNPTFVRWIDITSTWE